MKFSLETRGDWWEIRKAGDKLPQVISLVLTKIGFKVQGSAKENAPYLTGKLRESISVDTSEIKSGIVVVGSQLKYARRREYENKAHPDKLHYLERWYTENISQIEDIRQTALDTVLNKK